MSPRVFKLTIVVPAYNEESTVKEVVSHLISLHNELPGELEIIVVNDGSTDATGSLLEAMDDQNLTVIHHEVNKGKGAAVRTGIAAATGTHVLIFDADSEYDPNDIPRVVAPLISGRAEVVYGSRMSGFGTVHPTLVHRVGNHMMTLFANLLFGAAISDLHTCIKLLPTDLLRNMKLTEQGFGLDTEISAEMLRAGFRPFELPISYVGRSKEDGKKIKFSDSLVCLWVLVKVRARGKTSYGLRNRMLVPRVRAGEND